MSSKQEQNVDWQFKDFLALANECYYQIGQIFTWISAKSYATQVLFQIQYNQWRMRYLESLSKAPSWNYCMGKKFKRN